jgi:hypothetical protein
LTCGARTNAISSNRVHAVPCGFLQKTWIPWCCTLLLANRWLFLVQFVRPMVEW